MVRKPTKNAALALSLVAVVFGMVGVAFASVPLYRLFCEVTGYGGTTQRAERDADRVLDRAVRVRFDANVSGLPWRFTPEVLQMDVKLGETALVNYIAENTGGAATTGTATFNVEPGVTGIYFNKIECFCFAEQTLEPGERIVMPVQFFVSPDLAEDRDLDAVRTITLSYTFFPVPDARQPVAQAEGDGTGRKL